MAANPTCPPCMLTLWDPTPRQASRRRPICWPSTAAATATAAFLTTTSYILQNPSLCRTERSLQLATTLILWPWAQMGLWCSGHLLTVTVQCLWASADSLLSLGTSRLLCRVSPLEVPHRPSRVLFKETILPLFKGCCQETFHLKV